MSTKIIRFTKANGNPYTGSITFSSSIRYGRDSLGNNVLSQCSAVDLGGGYVQVTIPSTPTLGVGYLVVPSTGNTDIAPRAQFVSDGPAAWFYASTDPLGLPNTHAGPSMVTVVANDLTGASATLPAVGAGSVIDSEGTPLFGVLRANLPDVNSWAWVATSNTATKIYPKADSRDLRTRIVYPPSSVAKIRWSGDFSTGDWSQWSPNRHYGDQIGVDDDGDGDIDRRISSLPDGIDDRILIVRHERYNPATQYGFQAHPKFGDLHSGGTRAEVVAKGTVPPKQPGDNYFYKDDEVWVSWASKLAPDWETNSKWHVISQAHQVADESPLNGGPPIAFVMHGQTFSFSVLNGYYDKLGTPLEAYKWRTTLRPGFWNHFLVNIKWSQDPNIGFVQLWVNGVEIALKRPDGTFATGKLFHTTLDIDEVVYWKLGLYRSQEITQQQTVHHSDFVVYNEDPRGNVLSGSAVLRRPTVVASGVSALPGGAALLPRPTVVAEGGQFPDESLGQGFAFSTLARVEPERFLPGRDLALGPDGDLLFEGGRLALTTGVEAIQQSISMRLRLYRGEFFRDVTAGMPHYELVLVKNPNLVAIRAAFTSCILDTPGVLALSSLSLDYSSTERRLTVTATVTTDAGELTLNALEIV